MVDNLNAQQRSYAMSRIRSEQNKSTEIKLVELFKKSNITGWSRHVELIGNPDFIFRKERIAIFVDGCFWHGCPYCNLGAKSNTEYWGPKIDRNRRRDKVVNCELRSKGWRVLRVREHTLKKNPRYVVKRISVALNRGDYRRF